MGLIKIFTVCVIHVHFLNHFWALSAFILESIDDKKNDREERRRMAGTKV